MKKCIDCSFLNYCMKLNKDANKCFDFTTEPLSNTTLVRMFHSTWDGTGNKISFAFTLCNTGAYVNGYMSWTIPFLNPFSKKCRRFVRANNNMQKYLRQKAKDEYNQQLINALI